MLLILVVYRLLSPGSEWRLHREWYGRSALSDLLGMDRVIDEHALYDCHDLLLEHKTALFDHLVGRWRDLFNVSFDVLLYDLTSTYFEIGPPLDEHSKRQFGYSRDHRSDCVQVVIALVITPEGFPLAYEVLAGNTADNTTLRKFLTRIERQYGKARRIWLCDRGSADRGGVARDADLGPASAVPGHRLLSRTTQAQAPDIIEGGFSCIGVGGASSASPEANSWFPNAFDAERRPARAGEQKTNSGS